MVPSPPVAAKMPRFLELGVTDIGKTLGGGTGASPKVTLLTRVSSTPVKLRIATKTIGLKRNFIFRFRHIQNLEFFFREISMDFSR
jgi:hypothetical protein